MYSPGWYVQVFEDRKSLLYDDVWLSYWSTFTNVTTRLYTQTYVTSLPRLSPFGDAT
jgi:hypothetical protein